MTTYTIFAYYLEICNRKSETLNSKNDEQDILKNLCHQSRNCQSTHFKSKGLWDNFHSFLSGTLKGIHGNHLKKIAHILLVHIEQDF